MARWAVGASVVVAALGLTASGTAQADERDSGSHDGPVYTLIYAEQIGLINTGQIDDPMEDVLEHVVLNLGDNNRGENDVSSQ
ncbi:hypothetical protein [Streptomyces sp. HNM0574]|uniref:hypothetical protein n=1 Tax=Streptomyces sp. HNM0574 TaxID=2714954 RepID=UPI001F11858B|nr:hypothetical protein [Streptomyces sp. HNM0574]